MPSQTRMSLKKERKKIVQLRGSLEEKLPRRVFVFSGTIMGTAAGRAHVQSHGREPHLSCEMSALQAV